MKKHLMMGLAFFALSGVAAADTHTQWAVDEALAGDFGQSAGFVIESMSAIPGEEYIDESGLTCVDVEVSVVKSRTNKAGKLVYSDETETITVCRETEPEPV